MNLRNAVSWRMRLAFFVRRLHDSVDRALDGVVAPSGQQIACVHDNGALYRRGVDELPRWALDLQAASVILEQQRDGAVVLRKQVSVQLYPFYSCSGDDINVRCAPQLVRHWG